MAAAEAALETYELLENIISQLPARSITKVMRVSKAWKTIATSPRIHNSRILSPKGKRTNRHSISRTMEWTSFPVYDRGYNLRLHYAFPTIFSGCVFNLIYRSDYTRGHPALRNAQNNFATYPPCQAICLNVLYDSRGVMSECTVYKKHGIRIKDVLEIVDAMLISVPPRDSNRDQIVVRGGFLRW